MMTNDHRPAKTLSLEMPIYDGGKPVENLLPNMRSRRIYNRLLREQINRQNRILDEARHWIEIELVLKALMIGEFMDQQGIEDIKRGIKRFYAFQQQQLAKLLVRGVPLVGFYGTR